MSGVGTVQSWLQAGPVARAAVRWALAQLGDPYRWGATGPDSFDCSGLTSSAYAAAGVSIPRVSRAQWGAGPHVAVDRLLPGDLLFYADNPGDPASIHHVGMYIGNGLMVHAPHTGDVVRVASIWRESYAGATRIVPGVITPGLPGPPPTAPPPTSPTPPPPPPMTTSPPTSPAVAGAADDPAADLDQARVAHHHGAADHDDRAADHGPADDGPAHHGPTHHHRPAHDGAPDHGPANHRHAHDRGRRPRNDHHGPARYHLVPPRRSSDRRPQTLGRLDPVASGIGSCRS